MSAIKDNNKIKLRFTFDAEINGLNKGQVYDAIKCDRRIGRLPAVWIVYEDGNKQLCPFMWFELVENYTYYIDKNCASDSIILFCISFKQVRIVLTDNKEIIAEVGLYESECDSDDDMAGIGLSNGYYYKQDEIRSIEIIGDSLMI